MKKYLFHVGIDISKSNLDVVLVETGTPVCSEHFIVDNNPKGVNAIIDLLKKRKLMYVKYCFVLKTREFTHIL